LEEERVIDHISVGVSDLARSMALYDAVLSPLGFARVWTAKDAAGYGHPNRDDGFAIKHDRAARAPSALAHIAFVATTRETVVAFHEAGVAQGAVDEGAPGLCPEYGAGYFASFLRDQDGHRIEAVLHE
jgi:catechol 2,3-dioxygenase-like lactoylglutathione lyase family enzyme